MSLPPEKLSELRQLIHSRVSQLGVQEQIRGFLAETQEGGRGVDEETLLRALEERGMVDQVLQSLHLNVGRGGGEEGAGLKGGGGLDTPHVEVKTADEPHLKGLTLSAAASSEYNYCITAPYTVPLHTRIHLPHTHSILPQSLQALPLPASVWWQGISGAPPRLRGQLPGHSHSACTLQRTEVSLQTGALCLRAKLL